MPKPDESWAALNERQQAYLKALYDCDQSEEAYRRERAARGDWFDRTPASEWRWQMYGPVGPPSQLYSILRMVGLVDPGTGATWQALEDRGLVECRYVPDALNVAQLLEVKITPRGRKAVRAGTGEQAYKAPPRGQLRERQWACLARLYHAGDEGIEQRFLTEVRGGFDWWATVRRLEEYKPQPLIEAYNTRSRDNGDGTYTPPRSYWRVTKHGRDYYEREWASYRGLYPGVEAGEPHTERGHDA